MINMTLFHVILAFMQLLLKEWIWSLTCRLLHTSITMLTLIQNYRLLSFLLVFYFIYYV